MKPLIACLVVTSLLIAVPSAATPKTESLMDCVSPCGFDSECIDRCADKAYACLDCCHMKLPSASKEHCQTSCRLNLNSYMCSK